MFITVFIRSRPRICVMFRNKLFFFTVRIFLPNPEAGGPPLDGCPRLLSQYVRSYPPRLWAVPSIHNRRIRRAVVTGTHIPIQYNISIKSRHICKTHRLLQQKQELNINFSSVTCFVSHDKYMIHTKMTEGDITVYATTLASDFKVFQVFSQTDWNLITIRY
jgi:hypothetical protein